MSLAKAWMVKNAEKTKKNTVPISTTCIRGVFMLTAIVDAGTNELKCGHKCGHAGPPAATNSSSCKKAYRSLWKLIESSNLCSS